MPAILQLKEIHKRYGPRVIFDDANATLTTDQKAGFIVHNGAGKSTLCKIITGQEPWRCGKVAGRWPLWTASMPKPRKPARHAPR